MGRILVLASALLLLGAGMAIAEPEPFRVEGLPRGGSLTIREAPDADATPVEAVPVGRRILGFGCTNETPSGNTWAGSSSAAASVGRVGGISRRIEPAALSTDKP
jgi:hypothetical protein